MDDIDNINIFTPPHWQKIEHPKVSVIVPIYGVEKYIDKCVKQLFLQTLNEIEFIFIDDCSPDKSVEILAKAISESPSRTGKLVFHKMEKNSGQALVRKWGIQNATGEYIIHCDPDDWPSVGMYKTLYDKAQSVQADIVVCDYYMTDGCEKTMRTGSLCNEKNVFLVDFFLRRVPTALWNKMVKRTLFTDYTFVWPTGNMGEDTVILSQVLLKSRQVTHISEPLYYYMINPSSITYNVSEQALLKRFNQAYPNALLLYALFKNERNINIKNAAFAYIYKEKCLLLPLIEKDEKYRVVFKEAFKGMDYHVYLNKYLSVKEKVLNLFVKLGIFPR